MRRAPHLGQLVLLIAFNGSVRAQELVPNGDLEQHTQCPDYISEIDRATGWSRPTGGTSDYLHSCSTDPFASVPSSQFGDQAASSGEGYAGLYAISDADTLIGMVDGYREYITHALASPLVPGQAYRVRFRASLGEISSYAVRGLGALLSVQAPHAANDRVLQWAPQVYDTSNTWLDDKDDWMNASGCFIADSAYAYITIGNFRDSVSTPVHYVPGGVDQGFSYYFIDDVSLTAVQAPHLGPDTTVCGPTTIAVLDPHAGTNYTWSTGESGPSIVVDTTGTYRVRTDGACALEDSIQVTVGDPFTIGLASDTLVDLCATPVVRLQLDSVPPDAHIQWSTGATQPWIIIDEPETYAVLIEGPGICPSSASIDVIDACEHPIFTPNAFSPNGDGINDVWRPLWRSNPDGLLALEIYDRWGRVLFTAEDGRMGWDGASGGSPVPIGVYAYRLLAMDAGSLTDRSITGHVTVVR